MTNQRGTPPATDTVAVEDVSGTLVVSFNRPDKLNALNEQMIDDIQEVFAWIGTQPQHHAVVVTGAGRAFMSGADIAGYATSDDTAFAAFQRRGRAIYRAIEDCPAIVIAAINGYALGGGFEIALACDIRLAADDARMGLPEIKLGLIPGGGGTARLRRMVGPGVHKELVMSGRALTAEEAHLRGLVTRVVAAEELLPAAIANAAKLQTYSRTALLELKAILDPWQDDRTLEQWYDLEYEALLRCYNSPDGQEGIHAFVEKRNPEFNRHTRTTDTT